MMLGTGEIAGREMAGGSRLQRSPSFSSDNGGTGLKGADRRPPTLPFTPGQGIPVLD